MEFRLKDAIGMSVATCLHSAAANASEGINLKEELELIHKNLLCLTALFNVTRKKYQPCSLPPQVNSSPIRFPQASIPQMNKVFHLDVMSGWNLLITSKEKIPILDIDEEEID
uniref:Uncharacterized protein n=1 Tax=Aureoumbra lagunensis TaxID=44058 RepID=A0A7S3NPF8_9STRA|mmetsp:Transcript_12783/g.19180  ORF Transcript_12783/g.19180 Transcript_12783/m.19180 type:complete len:113 (-) Transcript_12783:74-412(-)